MPISLAQQVLQCSHVYPSLLSALPSPSQPRRRVHHRQIPTHSILRLLQRPSIATRSAPMQRLSSTSQRLMFCRAPAPPGWSPSALAQRRFPVTAARCPVPHRAPRIRQGYQYIARSRGVQSAELGATDKRSLFPSAIDRIRASNDTRISLGKHFPITKATNNEDNRGATQEFFTRYGDVRPAIGDDDGMKTMDVIYDDKDAKRTTVDFSDFKQDIREVTFVQQDVGAQSVSEVSDDEEYSEWPEEDPVCYHSDDIPHVCPIPLSSHRDGAIYRGNFHWRKEYHIADRNETRLEAKMLSDPSSDCVLNGETCLTHKTRSMWQIFSFKFSRIHLDCGSVELYGYIAARDHVDPLLNYCINISRDDPVIVQQGSLIEMTGPKRGIDLSRSILIEYDMRIKRGDREEDDLQLIDGASIINDIIISSEPVTKRIHGQYGAVDMNQMCLEDAVEATVEVIISEVKRSFDLCISCFTSGFLHDKIRLFDGAIGESCGLRRHVIAVQMGTCVDLKFEIGSGSGCCAEHCHSFKAAIHGCSSETINMELASVSVKVYWSTLNKIRYANVPLSSVLFPPD